MTDVIETSFELPTIEQVTAILAMCDKYDLPLSDLPNLWDKYTALQQVERRCGIQNGNMERDLMRLTAVNDSQAKSLREALARVAELEALGLDSAAYLRRITELEDQIERFTDKYEALLLRCKHFEEIANPRKLEDLEDIIEHYRCGMNGMKELADNKHFSHEWRLWLIRRTLYVFEPQVKGQQNA